MRCGNILLFLVITMLRACAQVPVTNVSATILYGAARHGYALPPYEAHVPFKGITVFCTVVVENNSGAMLTVPRPRFSEVKHASVFDMFFLTVCDDAGKGLGRYSYHYQEVSGTTLYAALPEGRSTNELYYLISEAPTNNFVRLRLEGSVGSAGSVTSNVVKARVY